MKRSLFVLAVLLAACSSGATGPQAVTLPAGIDPLVLILNGSTQAMTLTWWSQSGLTAHDSVGPASRGCFAFFSAGATDSVRFVVTLGDTAAAGSSQGSSPWFDPTSGLSSDSALNALNYPHGAEWWTAQTTSNVTFRMAPDSVPPCTP